MKAQPAVGDEQTAGVSDDPFRLLVEQAEDAIFCYESASPISIRAPVDEQIAGLQGAVLVDCNAVYAKLYGANSAREAIGSKLVDLLPVGPKELDEMFRPFIENGYRTIGVEQGYERQESPRRFERNVRGFIEDGFLVRVWGTLRDITARKQAESALRDSEARTRALLEANPDLIFRLNRDGRFLDCHVGDKTSLVLPENELLGRTVDEVFSPKLAADAMTCIHNAIETGELQLLDYELPIDGTDRQFEARFVRCGDVGVIVTIRDFTERRKIAAQLHVEQTRLKEAQRIGRTGCWEFDPETNELWWSDECFRFFGVEPGDFVPTFDIFIEGVHPDDREGVIAARKRGMENSGSYEVEYRLVTPSGTVRTMYTRGEPITDRMGRRRVLGIVRDITEQRKAERRLRRSEARLKEAQRMALVCNWERDLKTGEVWWSEETFSVLGLDPAVTEATYENYLARLHPDDRVHALSADLNDYTDADELEKEYRIVRPTGEIRVVHTRVKVTRDADGQPSRLMGTTQDITDRVALEREIINAKEDEQRRLGQELHDGLGQTLVGASLSAGSLYTLLQDESSPHAAVAKTLAEALQRSILESRHLSHRLYPAALDRLGFAPALKALADEADRHSAVNVHATIVGDGDSRDLELEGHLYRIAQEALTNALKHAKAENIELRYERRGRHWSLEVLDDGIGLPADGERAEGIGLRGMRYRSRVINGHLSLDGRPGGGTHVRCFCTA